MNHKSHTIYGMESIKSYTYNLLRKSETFFKADMVYVAKGNSWQILGQVVTSLLALAMVMIFANYLPKETYGLYRYILSLAGILGVFTLMGMNQAVSQAVATGDEGALRASIRYQLKWNVLQFFAFCTLSAYYFYNHNTPVAASLLVMGIFSPLTQAFNTYGAYLSGKKEFRLNNIFSIISTAVYVAGMAAIVILNGEVFWLIVVYSLSTLGATLVFYIVTLRIFKPPATKSADALKYGRELTFIGFIGPIVSQLDKIILTHFWGATQLAVYSLALAVPDRATIAIKNLVGIGMPKFSTKTPNELNKVFYLRIFQGMLIGALCTAAYVVLSPYLFKYLLPKYLDALLFSQLLSISFIFSMPNRYISLLMTSQKLSKLIFANSLIQNVIRVSLYVVLGIFGGILGLVIAQILNSFISMLINIVTWRTVKS